MPSFKGKLIAYFLPFSAPMSYIAPVPGKYSPNL